MNLRCPIVVTLNESDIARVLRVAQLRHEHSLNRKDSHGYSGDSLAIHVSGCYGELVYCKGTGCEWDERVDNFKGADVGEDIQVRCAPCKAPYPPEGFGELMMRPADQKVADHKFVLVVGNPPNFVIRGWMTGRDAMQGKWWRDASYFGNSRPPAWTVPYRYLNHDLAELAGVKPLNGFVGYDDEGHFVHYCRCGKWGAFGHGVSLRTGKLGTWYCGPCNPNPMSSSR